MILLDTCALLWLTAEPARLSGPAQRAIRRPGADVYLSAFSAFELGVKVGKGKLALPMPLKQWFLAVCGQFGLRELPVTAAIAATAAELPPVHSDPADRIIIATALEHKLTVITPDERIHQYPNVKTLW